MQVASTVLSYIFISAFDSNKTYTQNVSLNIYEILFGILNLNMSQYSD